MAYGWVAREAALRVLARCDQRDVHERRTEVCRRGPPTPHEASAGLGKCGGEPADDLIRSACLPTVQHGTSGLMLP
jgi:hypothetical protein